VRRAEHPHIHHDTIDPNAPTLAASRGHWIGVGDVVTSRHNNGRIPVYDAEARRHKTGAPVRNGQRWRIIDVHASQGATADTTHTLRSDRAHKGLAHVGLTRGRDANHAYLYTQDADEADHAHAELTPGCPRRMPRHAPRSRRATRPDRGP
jgi:hypothetical protein